MQRRVPGKNQQGLVLIALISLLIMGTLAFLVSNLSPEFMQADRQRQTDAALIQAREALIGYALQYRDQEASQGRPDRMYGYLPLPDLGTSRNNNVACSTEGCDANTPTGITCDANSIYPTMIGRFPWRTLGTGPLRDSSGECLWLIVSSLHLRKQCTNPTLPPMNWDTLGQMDLVVAQGTTALQSALASAHDRPIAIIFSPGYPLPGQDRSPSSTDVVTECGGNYDAKNYLDPANAEALGDVTNYLSGANNASGVTGDSDPGNDPDTPKAMSIQGIVQRQNDGKLWLGSCPSGTGCGVVANDKGLALTADTLFATMRKNRYFRDDINSMLGRMAGCLRDQVAAGTSFTPLAIAGNVPGDKLAGRLPISSCYDDNQNPLGYYSHYKEMLFAAKPNTGNLTVNGDTCAGVLLFSNQRQTGQQRITATDKNTLANYLEGNNLTSFTSIGTVFTGVPLFDVTPPQAISQDIALCIPSSANLTNVLSPNLSSAQQLVAYTPSTGTLTLGKADVTNTTAGAANLFGCAWMTDAKSFGTGFRTYFNFTFSAIGNTGFTFAAIDAENNPVLPCGMAGSHLGYSGNNGFTPKVKSPKIGIEFDQSRNSGFPTTPTGQASTNAGREDPCFICSPTNSTADSHVALLYWGHENANSTDAVLLPDNDDNVHGFPTEASLTSLRRPPKNPDTAPGILPLPQLRTLNRKFHVRIEITPTRNINTSAAENSTTTLQTKVWILADSATVANQIAAMKNTTRPMSQLYPGFTETLSDTAAVFDVATGTSCSTTPPVVACPTNQYCGTDNLCYRQAMRKTRLGFTGSQRTQAQDVNINNLVTTWLQ